MGDIECDEDDVFSSISVDKEEEPKVSVDSESLDELDDIIGIERLDSIYYSKSPGIDWFIKNMKERG